MVRRISSGIGLTINTDSETSPTNSGLVNNSIKLPDH